ncbi:MAG: endo-1,4-beta-xylanase [Eubacterium sp.]
MRLRKLTMGTFAALGLTLILTGCGQNQTTETKKTTTTSAVTASAIQDEKNSATTLKDAFADDFKIGVATSSAYLSDSDRVEEIKETFNSITMENEMKPESILDWQGSEKSKDGMPAIKEETLKNALEAAQGAGVALRGHTLVWHSQTPEWFFSKGYDPSKGLVDKMTMKKRMESYIKQVLTYCKENYPGVVYAWDVVNEAVGDDGDYRTESMWYETYGDFSYIKDAFTFARKYAEEGTKLFLNDYNEYIAQKRDLLYAKVVELHDAGLLDGVGMQSHWDMEFPSVDLFETALEKYATIDGIEIQLTEIDMHNTDDSEEGLKKQADRYKEFFDILTKMDREGKANITSVTFWGLKDGESWLSGFKGETSYPLLFSDDMEKKPCYESILEVAKTAGK